MMQRVHIVMVETSHPGNIGAAARAMKTMGLTSLRLVNPKKPHAPEVKAMASGADDVLDQALHFDSLSDAVADCHLVIGTSARSQRTLSWPQWSARKVGEKVAALSGDEQVALVFGRERSGLSNEELDYCQVLAHIPMAFDYFSLNIAQAIQVFCYEITQGASANNDMPSQSRSNSATQKELAGLFDHFEQAFIQARYLDPDNPRLLMRRIRRMFARTGLETEEVNLLRGMLSAFQGAKFRPRD